MKSNIKRIKGLKKIIVEQEEKALTALNILRKRSHLYSLPIRVRTRVQVIRRVLRSHTMQTFIPLYVKPNRLIRSL